MSENFWPMVVGLVLRHALGALAGMLITYGMLDKSATEQFVTIGVGVVSGAAALVWSWWQKRGMQKLAEDFATLKRLVHGGGPKGIVNMIPLMLCLLALSACATARPQPTTIVVRNPAPPAVYRLPPGQLRHLEDYHGRSGH